ncbi:hypothetical protein [uncultured Paracoccus sp.]|uniref:hypothetical protein n=1 Tax=uncultured Paracoccus sp. TaxID=189685 RepID=UPI002634645F|nr:hypothetical protein [uncultured Paracoccus sp.]
MELYGFSDDPTTGHDLFRSAVSAVASDNFYEADGLLRKSMLRGFMPAYFNSAILNGQGCISPFNIDYAVECYRTAAQLGHERAAELLQIINNADIAHLTISDITNLATALEHGTFLNPIHTMVACRFYKSLCEKTSSLEEVILYEIEAASQSEYRSVLEFVDRTGIPPESYEGAYGRLVAGSPADKITDGLNELTVAMSRSGASERSYLFQRCTIVGYLVSRSRLGKDAKLLLGIEDFFEYDDCTVPFSDNITDATIDPREQSNSADNTRIDEDEAAMFFKKKPRYEAIFSSPEATHKYLYEDRRKTADILGDDDFVSAWLDSKNRQEISTVIRKEALKGDVPSIKQMIWLANLYYNDSDNIPVSPAERDKIKKATLKDVVFFSEKAVSMGLEDRAYQAMVAHFELYGILSSQKKSISDPEIISSINGIVRNAKTFASSGYDDPDLIDDAKSLIERFSSMVKVINALNK